jgi:hypothetical protein
MPPPRENGRASRRRARARRDRRSKDDLRDSCSRVLGLSSRGEIHRASSRVWSDLNCPVFACNRTKMFHVKHFCPIAGPNYTRPYTPGGLKPVGLRGRSRSFDRRQLFCQSRRRAEMRHEEGKTGVFPPRTGRRLEIRWAHFQAHRLGLVGRADMEHH